MKRGLYCPTCRKDGMMAEKPVEWGEGIVVRGFQCGKCGEELISAKEHAKALRILSKRRNTLTLSRELFRLGKSLALRIPYDVVEKLHLRPKQKVDLYTNEGALVVKPT